ncbi:MAG: aminomethyl-transferring glycine dehydrogenase [Verrucomicrobia bacterium]|nr:aminomethyl-transferring glycine dehydrogenase [Verrucomicrobiota bacterium]
MLEPEVSALQAPTFAAGSFAERHIGPRDRDLREMLKVIGCESLDELIDRAIPEKIRAREALRLPEPVSEYEALSRLQAIAKRNRVAKSYLGLGYHACITPPAIQRHILENPGWYTAYTPYQAEIAQGRLEALLNFQTMVTDLTGLDIANASLLDEGTAAAEAMALAFAVRKQPQARIFFVSQDCHPQTIRVVQTRAEPHGIRVVVGDHHGAPFGSDAFGYLVQYPGTDGTVFDYGEFIREAHRHHGLVIIAADLLGLTLLTSPGELGADVCVGSSQRFGVPVGFGGPHAAFFATRDQFKRHLPGRLVGVSRDAAGRVGYRLALQTREQHIRRDKATSNICTAQVLLAVMASMYAVYHGPERLRAIARRIHRWADGLAATLQGLGFQVAERPRFDTVRVYLGGELEGVIGRAREHLINVRVFDDRSIGIALDETTSAEDVADLVRLLRPDANVTAADLERGNVSDSIPEDLRRRSRFLTHSVFNSYHTETELMRYIKALEAKDLSLTRSMIPLGSCTMKLNAAAELYPISWPEFSLLHPFAPPEQWRGYAQLIRDVEGWLAEITGFEAVSVQPNAGSQGEYAGLLVIREYHRRRGQPGRTVCLIPSSAHGTNPASAAMAGLEVVAVACDAEGNIDLADLQAKAERHTERLAALMVTYPSTHGVFEETITEICEIIHRQGGQVYMDGANMNAQVGLCRPGDFGADVCHLNLHKTFCIPHGGGGPGMGPIGVKAHLAPYLPGHPWLAGDGGPQRIGPVSAAPFGSASLLPITWMYLRLMGPAGLRRATQVAVCNANYVAARLGPYYPVLYRGRRGLVAHECILDLRRCKRAAGIEVEDVAKRLMDYGFHAPTVSWPVAGTLMLEPTESESKAELDRFCEAMIAIYGEIRAIESGEADPQDNVLKRAPHPAEDLVTEDWGRAYSRESAAYPLPWLRGQKFWPAIGRIDNVYGDRNLFCSCVTVEEFADDANQ